MLPLGLGGPGHFAAVRDFFRSVGYTEPAVCKQLSVDGLHQLLSGSQKSEPSAPKEAPNALAALMRLFLVGNSASREWLDGFIPATVQDSMEALGILCADNAQPGRCYSPVAIYPVRGLFIASDRWKNPDGSPVAAIDDYVFPAIHLLTHQFLELLPTSSCETLLDLGSGTGIAALLASQEYARQSWAVDITARATQFGEFNRRLNALSNARVLQGNLYEPVEGLRFERIVAHPPFVPSMERGAIYADGGGDGEQITRAIVQGLPRFLERRGCLYCSTMGVEREGEPYEQRVRQWLDPDESAFDVLFVAERTQGPTQFAYRATRHAKGSWDQMDEWCAHLEKLKVKNFVYGLLLIQEKDSTRSAFTVRRQKAEYTGAAQVQWLRDWESRWATAKRSCVQALASSTIPSNPTCTAERFSTTETQHSSPSA